MRGIQDLELHDEPRRELRREPHVCARTPLGGRLRHPLHLERILIGLLLPIGDTLLTTPALAALHRRYPDAEITALVSASNKGVLEGNPAIARCVQSVAVESLDTFERFVGVLRELREERFDLVINLSAVSVVVTRLGVRARHRMILDTSPWWWLVGGSREYRETHTVDHYFRTLAPLGITPPTPEERVPRLYLSDADRREARQLLRERGIRAGDTRVALHVGGDGFDGRKRWAPERFAAVAKGLIERCDAQILLIGGSVDRELSERTAALIGERAHVLAGESGLKATAALIEASQLFIGNDSAPLHMAAAVGTPAVGIFGPSDWNEFTPVGAPGYEQRVIHSNLPCSPCFRFIANDPVWKLNPCHSFACLKAISSERVLEAARDLLANAGGGTSTAAD